MARGLRNGLLAVLVGASASLVTLAVRVGYSIPAYSAPIWSNYGLPFRIYSVEVVDTVGSFHYFYVLNLVTDVLVWSGVALVAMVAASTLLARARFTRDATQLTHPS